MARGSSLLTRVTVLGATLLLFASMPAASAVERDLYVAGDGSDSNPGTRSAPFATLEHGLRQLEGGDRLLVGGGVYEERIRNVAMPHATAANPTRVQAVDGQQPVVRGLLWVRGGSHWQFDGIDVTWDPSTGRSNEHMVKVTDGTDWVFGGAEISGARSFAGMLVAGTGSGEPARWEVSNNCIRDTRPTNGTNQDHNLYVNTDLSAGHGLIEGNLLFGAPNGENIKLGPAGDVNGTANVTVRHNTLYGAVQNVLFSGQSRNNVLERNILGGTADGVASIRSYRLTGTDNVARDNIGFATRNLVQQTPGLIDGGDNRFPLDPRFDHTASCDGFVPTNPDTRDLGHTATTTSGTGDAVTAPNEREPREGSSASRTSPVAFADVDVTGVHAGAIAALKELQILNGVTDTTFGPRRNLSRAQIASGLYRVLERTETLPAATPRPVAFTDIRGSAHTESIVGLASRGILEGKTRTTFAPNAHTTRGQLASVLVRAYERNGGNVPSSTLDFSDLGSSPHADNIRRAVALDLVRGYEGGHFDPQRPVTREQFASMLHRFYLLAEGDRSGSS
jgi:hypothetical protein